MGTSRGDLYSVIRKMSEARGKLNSDRDAAMIGAAGSHCYPASQLPMKSVSPMKWSRVAAKISPTVGRSSVVASSDTMGW